jgi:predicted ATPase
LRAAGGYARYLTLTRPNFELNDAVLPAMRRTCRMVDGMPLAIVPAPAWIDTLT